jgi:putative transposase
MTYHFLTEQRSQYALSQLCQVLGVSRSGYYAWQQRQPSQRARANQLLLTHIRAIYATSRQTYGSPRVHAELIARGWVCNRKRVARLMRLAHLQARHPRPRPITTQVDGTRPVAPNRLNREFRATALNQKWVSDITYGPTDEGWLYLATVMDLYSRRLLGGAMQDSLADDLTQAALQMALARCAPSAGPWHQSDRGSQYASADYQALLTAHQCVPSMSRRGNCYDNAPMESFFSTLKIELIHRHHYHTRAEARQEIFAYIEGFYNTQRRHSALGYRSPLEFEQVTAPVS